MSDATGNLSVSSDERLKTIDGAFDRSVQSIIGLSPIMYHWNELSGLEMDGQYTGFSAQNVKEFIPEAVSKDANGYLTISDRPILATLVNSFKELWQKVINHDQTLDLHAQKIEELEARIADLEAMTAKNAEGSD
jgi:hypothetical protein